jgi:hypothetical protein
MPTIDDAALVRIVWLSRAMAIVAAIIGTAIVHFAYASVIRRAKWKTVVRVLTALALVSVYAASGFVLFAGIDRQVAQLNISNDFYRATVWVDPGPLDRFIPLVAIVLTWLLFSFFRRRKLAAA